MRKIETQMNMAIKSQKNWSSGNTQVITDNGFSRVFLHGNHIANVLFEFATGFSVFQKNWDWFVSDFQGKNIVDFSNGISISD